MSNLGEYLQMTTEAKELGGVDFYKEKYIEMGREDERTNRDDQENSDLMIELIATIAVPLVLYSGSVVYEKVKDLKKDDITIDKNIVKFNIIGKGNKQRLLYITYSHIKKHMIKYEKIRTESPDGFYFTTNKGKQVNDRYINTIVHNTLVAAQIEVTKKSSVHMLRHSVASYLKHTLKMDNASISKWLGHEDIRTTMIYLHYTEQEIIDMAKSFKKIGN